MFRLGDDPVATAVDRIYIAGTHEITFIGTTFGKRTMLLVPGNCILVSSTVRTAAEDSSFRGGPYRSASLSWQPGMGFNHNVNPSPIILNVPVPVDELTAEIGAQVGLA